MGEPFLAEIKICAFAFAPKGWAMANGQFMPINQNQALFSIIGTTYGGNGQTTFALPDLRGRTPVHVGQGLALGERQGTEAVTLTLSQLPAHNHFINAVSANSNTNNPSGNVLGASPGTIYHALTNPVGMAAENITFLGGNQAHNNMQPYLTLNFCVCLQGIFPSQN